MTIESNMSRRDFLVGAALVGGAAGLGLTACERDQEAGGVSDSTAEVAALSLAELEATRRELTAEQQEVYDAARASIEEWVAADANAITELCSKLIQAPSPSEAEDVSDCMRVVKGFCDDEKLAFQAVDYSEKLQNMISTTELDGPGAHLMLNGHLDAMPAGEEPGWERDPYSGDISDGKIWGRGASDMKCGVACEMYAYKYLAALKSKLPGKVSLTLVCDEETGYGRGTAYMFEQIPEQMAADCVLSAEPSGVESINFSSKGYIQFSVSVSTPGAIAGYANESESAILIAAQIITKMEELEDIEVQLPESMAALFANDEWLELQEYVRGEDHADLMTSVTVDACTIKGGSLYSVVAPDCTFAGAVVYPIGCPSEDLIARMQAIVDEYPEATLSIEAVDEPDYSDPTDEMVAILTDVVVDQGMEAPVTATDIAISDCRYWRYHGVPGFWYGPYGGGISTANEFVTVDDVLHTTRVLAEAGAMYLILSGK